MESRTVKTEIAILKFYQSFHIILLLLIILCHLLAVNKHPLIFKTLIIIFYLSLFIYFLNFAFLVISTILFFAKKYTPTLISHFKKIALSFLFFSVIKGISLTAVYWINFYYFPKFVEDCPFNFSTNGINKLIKNSKKEELFNNCNIRRCIFYNHSNEDNLNNYHYICNYNAEFYINNLECHFSYYRDHLNEMFYDYLEKCYENVNYYDCSSKEKRHDKFFIQNNKKCPKKFDKKRHIAIGVLFPLIDIVADVVIWLFIYSQYKRVIKFINFETFAFITRFSPSSLNSTKDSSIINPSNNNGDILTQINIQNQTEMIIYPPIDDDNKDNIDKNTTQKEIKVNQISGKEINNLADSKCDFIYIIKTEASNESF